MNEDNNYIESILAFHKTTHNAEYKDLVEEMAKQKYARKQAWIAEHEVLRIELTWGTYGKNGDEPLRRVSIADMSDNHLQACLKTQHNMTQEHRVCMEQELIIRGVR